MDIPVGFSIMHQIHAFHSESRAPCFKFTTLDLGDRLRSNPLSPLKTVLEGGDSRLKVGDSVAMKDLQSFVFLSYTLHYKRPSQHFVAPESLS